MQRKLYGLESAEVEALASLTDAQRDRVTDMLKGAGVMHTGNGSVQINLTAPKDDLLLVLKYFSERRHDLAGEARMEAPDESDAWRKVESGVVLHPLFDHAEGISAQLAMTHESAMNLRDVLNLPEPELTATGLSGAGVVAVHGSK